MKQIYLTIDDAVSTNFIDKVNFLKNHSIPAIFFCRGDRLALSETRLKEAGYAINAGYIMGNHLFSHTRVSTLSFETVKEELLKTDALIDKAYKIAGVERKYKFMRFPYIDRGCGAFPADKTKIKPEYQQAMQESMGLIQITSPLPEANDELLEHKRKIQELLKSEGFTNPNFDKVTYKWFKDTEFFLEYDVNFTMATGDSNMLPKYRYKGITMDDLFKDIDKNLMKDKDSAEVVIMHDYDEDGMNEVFETIINRLSKQVKFLGVENK